MKVSSIAKVSIKHRSFWSVKYFYSSVIQESWIQAPSISGLIIYIRFLGCWNKVPHTGCLKSQKCIVLELGSLRPKSGRLASFWELWGKDLFQASLFSFLMAAFSLSLQIVFPLFFSVFKFPLFIRTPVIWIRAQPSPVWPHLNYIHNGPISK